MSGHSKWSTIKRQKEAADKKRGQVFTKLAKAITLAAKEGLDPEINFKLRMAIEKAKETNMPKANIERAIEKAKGGGEEGNLEEIIYEGFASEGVAVMVEVATDNSNRSISELRSLFNKHGGRLADSGAVSYLFSRAGCIFIPKEGLNFEETALLIMEVPGVEDIEETEDGIEIYTKVETLHKVKESLEEMGLKAKETEIIQKPKSLVKIEDAGAAKKIINFLNQIELQEDVQKVYSNIDISEEILKQC